MKNNKHHGRQNGIGPLEHIFGSKTRVRILNLFFANPSQSFYLREISRRIGIRLNSIRREMENLKRYNIISEAKSSSSEPKRFFNLNINSLIYPELKALLLKGYLFLENDLVKAITKLGPTSLILLGGIFVDEKESPIDLLIVGRINNEKLTRLISSFEEKLGFEIKYTLLPKSEYQYRKLIADKFLYSILNGRHIIALDKIRL